MDVEQLAQIHHLREKGIISDTEFLQIKQKIMNGQEIHLPFHETEKTLWGYVIDCITNKYICFSGRARRKEYWSFVLFCFILSFIKALCITYCMTLGYFDFAIKANIVSSIIDLALFLPSLSVLVRRMHDVNLSGCWILTIIVPLVVIFLPSHLTQNKYGPVPAGVIK